MGALAAVGGTDHSWVARSLQECHCEPSPTQPETEPVFRFLGVRCPGSAANGPPQEGAELHSLMELTSGTRATWFE